MKSLEWPGKLVRRMNLMSELLDIYDYDCEKTCSMLISLRKKLDRIKRSIEVSHKMGYFITLSKLLELIEDDDNEE